MEYTGSQNRRELIRWAALLKTLSHPIRLRLLWAIQNNEMTTSELADRLQLDRAAMSPHLVVLRKATIIAGRREGQKTYYSLNSRMAGLILDALGG